MSGQVTKRQAEAALAAVKRRYKAYLEPIEYTDDDGASRVDAPLYSPPILDMAWRGGGDRPQVAILWEDGPAEWAHVVTMGGNSEEDRALIAEANREFGAAMKAKEHEPIRWPKGVYVEPWFSFVLCLYPA